ncbi:MAG: hypothetical protein P8Z42_13805 [Anaerolineales bacterium]
MSIQDALERLRLDTDFMKNVATWERIAPRPARYAEFPEGLDARLIAALRADHIAPLYTHQAAAVESALAGENVVIVTGTASGKTLCHFHKTWLPHLGFSSIRSSPPIRYLCARTTWIRRVTPAAESETRRTY